MKHTRRPRLVSLLRARLAYAFAALVALAVLVAAGAARAQLRAAPAPPPRGTIALSVPGQAEGPLELTARDSGFIGELAVENKGADPLSVTRVVIRGDDDDVRAPARLTARFAEGGGTALTVPPGGSRKIVVTWSPDASREPRVQQVFAHVVVTSSDEAAGEVAMGVKAQMPRGVASLTSHALSLIVFLPLAGAAFALAMLFTGKGVAGDAAKAEDKRLRQVMLGVSVAQCLLAFWLYDGFHADATRLDGNDGYQFIEHAVWIRALGAEYFIGVDGVSLPMVLLTAVLGLAGVFASFTLEHRPKAFYVAYMTLLTGVMGVFVSLDLVLFFCFWQAAMIALYFLIGVWGQEKKEQAAIKLFVMTLVGSALMLFAVLVLWSSSDPTYLVDGAKVPRSFAIPELMRVAFHAKKTLVFGLPVVKVAWVSLFLSFGVLVPIFPLHRWLPDALVAAPTPIALVLTGLVVKLGTYGVLRVCLGVLPEASRWAAGTIVALGVVGVVYGALCAMAQTDLKRMFAYATMSQMGFCLIGLGSLTPEGIAACLVQMTSHGVVGALLLVLVGALEERVKTRDIGRITGLGGEVPLYAALMAFTLLASLGLPGLVGFWGEALALFGAFPLYRALVLVAAIGIALTAAYHVGAIHRLLLGTLPDAWRKEPTLAPFGGKIPEITPRELLLLAPLAAITLVLGVWPVPLLSMIAGGVRDVTSLVNPPGPDQIALLFP